jgi:hypothetical protein
MHVLFISLSSFRESASFWVRYINLFTCTF